MTKTDPRDKVVQSPTNAIILMYISYTTILVNSNNYRAFTFNAHGMDGL